MNDMHVKLLGAIALCAAMAGAVLGAIGQPELAAELTTAIGALGAIMAMYLHVSPDMPIPDAWQEALGRIGILLGSLSLLVPLGCRVAGLDAGVAGKVVAGVGAIVGFLSAYAKKSPAEKKLSIVTNRPPLVLPILLLAASLGLQACGGLGARASRTEQCSALQTRYDIAGAITVGAATLGTSSAIGAAVPDDPTSRRVFAIGAAVNGALGAVAAYLRDQAVGEYGKLCETSTVGRR